jgi:hypothetical protein
VYQKFLEWIVPWLLGAVLAVLFWIGQNIQDMSKTLAVAVTRVDGHEKRLDDKDARDSEQDARITVNDRRITILEQKR